MVLPPIGYMDRCERDTPGRSTSGGPIWGCSVQAAFDVVKAHGYVLLQWSWPDAVFVPAPMRRSAFPCLHEADEALAGGQAAFQSLARQGFLLAQTLDRSTARGGGNSAKEVEDAAPLDVAKLAERVPGDALHAVLALANGTWHKDPLLTELYVAGSSLRATVRYASNRSDSEAAHCRRSQLQNRPECAVVKGSKVTPEVLLK